MKKVDPIDKYVGGRLRTRRLMLHMSQTDVANALQLTFQQVQKYENGTNRISASRLQRLCTVLDVPISFFFEGAPTIDGSPPMGVDNQSPSYVNDFLATSGGVALMLAFRRIGDPKMRRTLVALVEEIAANTTE
jgi:transcriptional regulator with XRE-family HTH domain